MCLADHFAERISYVLREHEHLVPSKGADNLVDRTYLKTTYYRLEKVIEEPSRCPLVNGVT